MNLPNKLTILRMCCIPVFIACFYIPWECSDYLAALIFTLAFITDALDGYIARKQNIVTNFGKFMDPIADKMLVLSAFILLCEDGRMPGLVVLVTTLREILISAVRMVVSGQGKVIAASIWGKLKTVLQFAAVLAVLLDSLVVWILGFSLSGLLVWASFAATIISCADYLIKNAKYIDINT